MRRRLLPPLLLLLTLTSTAWPRQPLDQLITKLDSARVEQGVAGVSFTLVTHDHVLWKGGLGQKDWDKPDLVTEDSLFRVGSLSKVFTAAALLQLQEAGRIQLTDRVRQHAPAASYNNPWEANTPLNIAHLLEHTAGLNDLTKEEFDNSDPKPLTLEEGLAFKPESRTVRWKPGLHSSYSNAGYGLAGYVIEQITQQRYEDVIQTRLFGPLGMASSGFFQSDASRAHLANGYQPDGKTPLRYWHMIMRPFGGIHSSARDMAPFLQMLLNEGRHGNHQLLSPASIRRLETPTTTLAARSGLAFGYGLGVYQYLRHGVLLRGHSGDGDGYLSFFGYSRALDTAYFLSMNRFHWPALRALRRIVEEWMVAEENTAAPAKADVPVRVLREYIGRYELAAWRFPWTSAEERARQAIRISLVEGVLHTESAGGSRQALIPVSDQHFRRSDEPLATSAFVRDQDGQLYFQEDDSFVRVPGVQ